MDAPTPDAQQPLASPPPAAAPHVGRGLPSYRLPAGFVARWLLDAALGRPRGLGADGLALLRGRRPRPRVEGLERAPREGACVVAMNHYERPGLRVWWCAALVSAALRERRGADPPLRWLITDRFEGFRMGGVRLPDAAMARLLGAVARAYGCLPVARPDGEAAARSAVLREARRTLRAGGALGVTPEAASGAGPQLAPAWPGSGAALAWLSGGSAPIVPVAVFDGHGGRLTARFGEPFALERDRGGDAAHAVMGAIASLLPPALRGPYAASGEHSP